MLKYNVVLVDLPEWETGEFRQVESFDNVELAIAMRDELNKANKYGWHIVEVDNDV